MAVRWDMTLSGTYHRAGEPGLHRRLSVQLRASVPSLLAALWTRRIAIAGTVDADELATGAVAEGELAIALRPRPIADLDLVFADDGGRRCRLVGRGLNRWRARLCDEAGRVLGEADIGFDPRADAVDVLASLRRE